MSLKTEEEAAARKEAAARLAFDPETCGRGSTISVQEVAILHALTCIERSNCVEGWTTAYMMDGQHEQLIFFCIGRVLI